MAALASDWLKHFSTSSPQPLNGFWRNLTGSKSSTSSINFVFFVPIGNPRWPPWPLIGWNSFRLLLRNCSMDFDETWQEASPQRPLSILCFLCRSEIQDGRPGLWLAETFFDFFSATAQWISTKLDRKQVLNVLYQLCVFRADRKSKMAALASHWLKHFSTSSPQPLNGFGRNLTGSKSSTSSINFVFLVLIGNPRWPPWSLIGWNIFQLLLRNRSMDFDETWQEASPQRPLSTLCFSCRSEIQDGRHGLWLAETLFDFFSATAQWILMKLDRNQVLNTLSSMCFSCRSEFQDGRPGLWLTETFFDFFSTSLEWISTKLDRKQVLNVLYQVCVFCANRKAKVAILASDWVKHFSTSSPHPLNGFWRNLTGNKSSMPSIKFVFFVPIRNPRWLPWPLIGWNIFRLLLRNRWMDFEETWQEASPQCPLSSLCFSCRSEIQDGRPGLWLAETFFEFFTATAKWILTKLDRKQVLNALYQLLVFHADRSSRMAALAYDWLKSFFDFFSATAEWILTKVNRKLVLNALQQGCVFHANWSSKMIALASDWLKHYWFFNSPQNGFWQNLKGSKFLMPSIKFVFFAPIGQPRWLSWPLIGWNIFDFFSETAEWILTKLNRKQVLIALYKVCVFRANLSSNIAAMVSWLAEIFFDCFSATAEWIFSNLDN